MLLLNQIIDVEFAVFQYIAYYKRTKDFELQETSLQSSFYVSHLELHPSYWKEAICNNGCLNREHVSCEFHYLNVLPVSAVFRTA